MGSREPLGIWRAASLDGGRVYAWFGAVMARGG